MSWCLAWQKSNDRHLRGSLLALHFWHWCFRTSQPATFHTHKDFPDILLENAFLQREWLTGNPNSYSIHSWAVQDWKESDLGARIVNRRFKAIPGQLWQKGRPDHRAWLAEARAGLPAREPHNAVWRRNGVCAKTKTACARAVLRPC